MLRQFIPPSLLKYFPLGLAMMVLVIYCMFAVLVFGMESQKNWCDQLFLANGTICIALLYWCLWRTARDDPGYAPQYVDEEREEDQDQNKRFCRACGTTKPERSHHCSQCRRCVLNMDHHCMWVANCIGLRNRKSFNLILFWGAMGMINATLLGLWNVEILWEQLKVNKQSHYAAEQWFHTVRCSITITMIGTQFFNGVGLIYFFLTNMTFVMYNCTTLDDMRYQQRKGHQDDMELTNPYDLGAWYNFTFYFGQNPVWWCLPVGRPKGDGYNWDKTSSHLQVV